MQKHDATAEKILELLKAALSTDEVQIENQSHMHVGHAGARSGGGHFFVTVRSAKFAGLGLLARQRLVNEAVQSLMDKEIHALSMKCIWP